MYCQTALMMSGRVAVWMPSNRASLLASLYCTGYIGIEHAYYGVRGCITLALTQVHLHVYVHVCMYSIKATILSSKTHLVV